MKRANNALRRSSVKLKSLSTGNADLQLIISQIKDVKGSFKSFMDAQEVLAEDLYAWSQKLDNKAIQVSFSYMLEVSSLWTEVQKAFYETLKKYKDEFDLILEGDKHVSQAKKVADGQEEVEVKAKRELQKATKKKSLQELEVLRAKVSQAEKAKQASRIDFSEKLRENEAVRMIRVKGSSMRLGAAYHEMASKCCSLFHAHHLISQDIPDVHGKELVNVRYKVNAGKEHVRRAEVQMMAYKRDNIKRPVMHGPQNSSSDQANSREDTERSSHPPTAPTRSLSPSVTSVATPSNVYPNIDDSKLNNFDTDRSNEKCQYLKMSAQECPRTQDGPSEPTVPNISPDLRSPLPYNPYYYLPPST